MNLYYTYDISVIPVLRELTHLPIMLDPSHATGKSQYVASMALAAIAAGADALMIEVHLNPAKALSDGPQSLTPKQYEELIQEMAAISKAIGRLSQPSFISLEAIPEQESAPKFDCIPA